MVDNGALLVLLCGLGSLYLGRSSLGLLVRNKENLEARNSLLLWPLKEQLASVCWVCDGGVIALGV